MPSRVDLKRAVGDDQAVRHINCAWLALLSQHDPKRLEIHCCKCKHQAQILGILYIYCYFI
jgi:hypothetical protein